MTTPVSYVLHDFDPIPKNWPKLSRPSREPVPRSVPNTWKLHFSPGLGSGLAPESVTKGQIWPRGTAYRVQVADVTEADGGTP